MFLLKVLIALSSVIITKPETFGNFLTFDEFKIGDPTSMLDLTTFTNYNNDSYHCLVRLSDMDFTFETYCLQECIYEEKLKMVAKLPEKQPTVKLFGKVIFFKSLTNDLLSNTTSPFILISLEGCYTVSENGSELFGSVLLTNQIEADYKLMSSLYSWSDEQYSNLKPFRNVTCEHIQTCQICFVPYLNLYIEPEPHKMFGKASKEIIWDPIKIGVLVLFGLCLIALIFMALDMLK